MSFWEWLKITVASADTRINIFMNMYKSSSLNSHDKPDILFCLKYHSKSFRKMANKKGDRFSPWRTPILQGKKADTPSSVFILDFMFLYKFCNNFKHLPFIQYVFNFCHKPSRQTVSKACLMSIKAQKSFFGFAFAMFIKLLITKKLSEVENSWRKPVWLSVIMS